MILGQLGSCWGRLGFMQAGKKDGILKGLAGKQKESLLLKACSTLSPNHLSAATRCINLVLNVNVSEYCYSA